MGFPSGTFLSFSFSFFYSSSNLLSHQLYFEGHRETIFFGSQGTLKLGMSGNIEGKV
jgi:hypothetical protein